MRSVPYMTAATRAVFFSVSAKLVTRYTPADAKTTHSLDTDETSTRGTTKPQWPNGASSEYAGQVPVTHGRTREHAPSVRNARREFQDRGHIRIIALLSGSTRYHSERAAADTTEQPDNEHSGMHS